MDVNVNGGAKDFLSLFRRDASVRTAGTVTANLGGWKIADSSTTAQVGDVYRAESGTTSLLKKEFIVIDANANDFTIASKVAPTASDTFYIMGPVTPRYDSTGASQSTIDTTGLATSARQDTMITAMGSLTETAPISDTASSGLNGRLQRIAQNITSMIALLPASLGSKAAAASLAVTQSAEDIARQGIITETAPASDVASSGQNGRLQRIAQRLTSLIALFPSAIGAQAKTGSLSITLPTDLNLTSTANSSLATLLSGAVFTGTSEDVSQYATISVAVFSDVASATDGLSMQQSTNGTNWDIIDVYSIPAGVGKTFTIGITAKFFRLVYTNGGTNQASFRLQSTYRVIDSKSSSVRPQDARTNDNDMEENLAYMVAFNGTTWDRVRTTGTGVIKVDLTGTTANATAVKVDNSAVTQPVSLATETTKVIGVAGLVPSAVTTNALSRAASTVYATNLVVKAGPGRLYQLTGYNSKASAQFIQIHNTTSLPADTAVPIDTFIAQPQQNFSFDLPIGFGDFYSTGITVCNSSTGPTKTIGSADCWFVARYL